MAAVTFTLPSQEQYKNNPLKYQSIHSGGSMIMLQLTACASADPDYFRWISYLEGFRFDAGFVAMQATRGQPCTPRTEWVSPSLFSPITLFCVLPLQLEVA